MVARQPGAVLELIPASTSLDGAASTELTVLPPPKPVARGEQNEISSVDLAGELVGREQIRPGVGRQDESGIRPGLQGFPDLGGKRQMFFIF